MRFFHQRADSAVFHLMTLSLILSGGLSSIATLSEIDEVRSHG